MTVLSICNGIWAVTVTTHCAAEHAEHVKGSTLGFGFDEINTRWHVVWQECAFELDT